MDGYGKYALLSPLSPVATIFSCYCVLNCVVCSFLSLLVLVTIWTQSKKLGRLKWLMLNHSFWVFLTMLLFTVEQPVVLPPATAFYFLGVFRHIATLRSTLLMGGVLLLCILNTVHSTGLVIVDRYMHIYPSVFRWFFTSRMMFFLAVTPYLIANGAFLLPFCIFLQSVSVPNFVFDAQNYDPDLVLFFAEPTFVYIRPEFINVGVVIVLVIGGVLAFLGICMVVLLAYEGHRRRNFCTASDRLHRSLLLCSIMQVGVNLFFLGTPLIFLAFIILFQINFSRVCGLFLYMLFSTAGVADSVSTLFLVKPYRVFIGKLWRRSLQLQLPSLVLRQSQ